MSENRSDVALSGHWICPFATRVEFALHHRGITRDLVDLPPSAVRGADFVLPGVEWSPDQTHEFVGRFEAFRRKRRNRKRQPDQKPR